MRMRTTIFALCLLVVGLGIGPAVVAGSGGQTGQQAAVGHSESASPVQQECSFPVSETDTTGETVTLDSEPDRIVVLQPSDAQIVWEIGADDRVVGMPQTQYTAYLDGRSGIQNVKTQNLRINVEQVVGLQPDLVLASNVTDVGTVAELRRDGLTVYHLGQVESLERIATNVETVGRLTGECAASRAAANEFRLTLETVERAAQRADDRPTVLYSFFNTTTGSGTHIHDVIQTAGGTNVAAEAGLTGYARLSTEVVVDRDPDWIVYPDDDTVPRSAPFRSTTALQTNQTIALTSNYISQPGPRVSVPLRKLADQWHPDALARANETTSMANVTTPNRTRTTSSADGTGFGIGGAVTALAVLTVLARRR